MNELYWAENRIETLKRRKKRCVCKYCGGPLVVKRILFNDVADARVELYCETLDDNEKKHQMNVARVSEIMAWGFRNTGLLSAEGFTVPLHMDKEDWAECMVMRNDQVSPMEESKG